MTEPLPPQYDPSSLERRLYQGWLDAGLFTARRPSDSEGRPYVIMMPPPNVTAVLHMGHGLNNTIQDALIRFERMRGRDTLWLPGTDHAGIATQNVVEKLLAQEGKTRFDIGRAAFEARVWEHVRRTGPIILDQLKAIGASADWSRTYFTLDEDLSVAVREAFVRLHQKGLIYRGKYIINWCPRCGTALSNEEAEKVETDGHLWHFQYPLADGSGHLTVATTRPETMLGDTAVAVHPADPRYQELIGQQLVLPIVGRLIPVVADDAIDPDFGTGAVKVTPAHDPLDFEIGRRHDLEAIEVLQPDGRMRADLPAPYGNTDRFAARKLVVAEFDRLGLLEKTETHRHAVAHCYRCDTVVEPPDSGLVLRRRGVRRHAGQPDRPDLLRGLWRPRAPGRRCARHLVFLVAGADEQPRLAGPDGRPGGVLPRQHSRHRAGDSVLLGGPDGDGRPGIQEGTALYHGLPARHGAGHG
jgi:valyl-tRNA synthetase